MNADSVTSLQHLSVSNKVVLSQNLTEACSYKDQFHLKLKSLLGVL